MKRRVEEAKRIMEKQMLQELEQQREAEIEAQKRKEVMESLARQAAYNNLAISEFTNGLAAYFCFPRALQIVFEACWAKITCVSHTDSKEID